jgi:small neutral amino acid transporter SnatA (MarC family)
MSGWLAIVAYVATLNPARTRLGIPSDESGRAEARRLVVGAVLGSVMLFGVAAAATALLGWLEISPEMFRIAAGFILVIVAAWMVFVPEPTPEPSPDSRAAWLWPVAYPRVISPEMLTLVLTTGASDGLGITALGLGVSSVLLVALGVIRSVGLSSRVLASVGRVLAVLLVLVGIWLAIQGIREV